MKRVVGPLICMLVALGCQDSALELHDPEATDVEYTVSLPVTDTIHATADRVETATFVATYDDLASARA